MDNKLIIFIDTITLWSYTDNDDNVVPTDVPSN